MKILTIKLSSLVLVCMGVFTSCQDIVTYNDNYDDGMGVDGPPVINAIYTLSDRETSITGGNLKQMIVLEGKNLSYPTLVRFNDVEVNLDDIYAKSGEVYLPIPRVLPETVNNQFYYETSRGNVTKEFEVTIPDLLLTGLYNEFALPGDTVQVLGDFFDLYGFGDFGDATIQANGITIEVDSLTTDYMSVILPQSLPENARLLFTYDTPDGQATQSITYRQTNDLMWDLSDPSSAGLWAGEEYITSGLAADEPDALFGPYIRVNGSFGAWSWNNLPCGGFELAPEVAANPGDYYFKFEVNSATSTPFYDSDGAGYIIQINGGWYAWNPSANISFNTYGNWRTITLELTEVAAGGLPEGGGWTEFFLILQPNSDWSVDHSLANFRIVKK